MKTETKVFYTCAVCGKVSTAEGRIRLCEAGHIRFGEDTVIRPAYNKGGKIPKDIEIEVPEGYRIGYTLNYITEPKKKEETGEQDEN